MARSSKQEKPNKAATYALALATILLTCALFYLILASSLQGIAKAILSIIVLAGCSFALQKLLALEGELGLLLFRTEKGLDFFDKLAKRAPGLWNFLADVGLVLGFGLSSMFLFKREIPKKSIFSGMICLFFFWYMIFPLVSPLALELINLSGLENSIQSAVPQVSSGTTAASRLFATLFAVILLIPAFAVVFGGLAFVVSLELFIQAGDTLFKISAYLISVLKGAADASVINSAIPGVAPVLPGVNIPLVEGVIALAIILIVHEGAHAVLGRVAKIPLKSAGVVFFGILPFGAFVDPDEVKLGKTDKDAQNRVLVAGSTANLLTATAFFFIFMAFYFAVIAAYPAPELGQPYILVTGVLDNGTAAGRIEPGMRIISWNGLNATKMTTLSQAMNLTWNMSPIMVGTDNGTFALARGNASQAPRLLASTAGGYIEPTTGLQVLGSSYTIVDHLHSLSGTASYLMFAFNLIGLIFVLNFLVGVVNLLPIPPFDGYRILSLSLGDRKLYGNVTVMHAIISLIVAAFAINLLPWIWR